MSDFPEFIDHLIADGQALIDARTVAREAAKWDSEQAISFARSLLPFVNPDKEINAFTPSQLRCHARNWFGLHFEPIPPVLRFVEWLTLIPGEHVIDGDSVREFGDHWLLWLGTGTPGADALGVLLDVIDERDYTYSELRKLAAEFEASPPLDTAKDCLRALLNLGDSDDVAAIIEQRMGERTGQHFRTICERARELVLV